MAKPDRQSKEFAPVTHREGNSLIEPGPNIQRGSLGRYSERCEYPGKDLSLNPGRKCPVNDKKVVYQISPRGTQVWFRAMAPLLSEQESRLQSIATDFVSLVQTHAQVSVVQVEVGFEIAQDFVSAKGSQSQKIGSRLLVAQHASCEAQTLCPQNLG